MIVGEGSRHYSKQKQPKETQKKLSLTLLSLHMKCVSSLVMNVDERWLSNNFYELGLDDILWLNTPTIFEIKLHFKL